MKQPYKKINKKKLFKDTLDLFQTTVESIFFTVTVRLLIFITIKLEQMSSWIKEGFPLQCYSFYFQKPSGNIVFSASPLITDACL